MSFEQNFGSDDKNNEHSVNQNTSSNYTTNSNANSGWSYSQNTNQFGQNSTTNGSNNSGGYYSAGNWGQSQPPKYSGSNEEYHWNFENYENNDKGKKPKKKRNRGLFVFTSIICAVLAVGIISFSVYGIYSAFWSPKQNSTSQGSTSSGSSDNFGLSLNDKPQGSESSTSANGKLSSEEVAEKVRPCVVGIIQYTARGSYMPTQSGQGSGIIMSDDGYIITNAHVINGADIVSVILYNDEEYEAKIIGMDTRTDLAVLKIDASNLTYAEFGNSEQLKVGEQVIAIGNPGGITLAGSVTQGIVSAVNRTISTDSGDLTCIQTDAAINPGNSGGALVNMYGQVIGINSAKIAETGYEGIGFAIPINDAKPIVDDLINVGHVTGRVKIGITVNTINELVANRYGVPVGVQVQEIESTSDAAAKGLQVGDIITEINGTKITESQNLTDEIQKYKAGEQVTLTIFRRFENNSDKTLSIKVTLQEDTGDMLLPSST